MKCKISVTSLSFINVVVPLVYTRSQIHFKCHTHINSIFFFFCFCLAFSLSLSSHYHGRYCSLFISQSFAHKYTHTHTNTNTQHTHTHTYKHKYTHTCIFSHCILVTIRNCFSGADLAALVREASVTALKDVISQPDIVHSHISVAKVHFEAAFQKVKPSVSKKVGTV